MPKNKVEHNRLYNRGFDDCYRFITKGTSDLKVKKPLYSRCDWRKSIKTIKNHFYQAGWNRCWYLYGAVDKAIEDWYITYCK